jgi:hypothetical protein
MRRWRRSVLADGCRSCKRVSGRPRTGGRLPVVARSGHQAAVAPKGVIHKRALGPSPGSAGPITEP